MILLNDIQIEPTIFPDNTSQVWNINLPDSRFAEITWRFEKESEFIHLAQLVTLLHQYSYVIILYLPYLPYGRQDKKVSQNTTFALRTFIKLLDSLNLDHIFVLDPHSSLIMEKLDNCTAWYPAYERILLKLPHDFVCYPDQGALNKYNPLINCYDDKYVPYIFGKKVRDQITGQITDYSIKIWEGADSIKDKTILIIDDICDGGATFIHLAKKLQEYNVKSISLFVSHGLFTKGLKPLKDAGIDHIYVYNNNEQGYEEK